MDPLCSCGRFCPRPEATPPFLRQVKGKGASGSFVVAPNSGKAASKSRDRKVSPVELPAALSLRGSCTGDVF